MKQTRVHFEQGDIPGGERGKAGRSTGTQGQWSADLNEASLAEAAKRIDAAEMTDVPAWMSDLTDLISDGISDAEIGELIPRDAFQNCWEMPLDEALAKTRRLFNKNAGGLSQTMKIALGHLSDEWKAKAKIPDGLVEAHVVSAALQAAETGVELTAAKIHHMRNQFRECLARPDYKQARRAMRRVDDMFRALYPHPRTLRIVMEGTNHGKNKKALEQLASIAAWMLALVELRLSEGGQGEKTTFIRKGKKDKKSGKRKPYVKVRRALPRNVDGMARQYWWMIVPPKPQQGFCGRPRPYPASLVTEPEDLAKLRSYCSALNRDAEKELEIYSGSFVDEEDPEFFGWPLATADQRRTVYYQRFDKRMRRGIQAIAFQLLEKPLWECQSRDDNPEENPQSLWGIASDAARIGQTGPPSFNEDGRPVLET